MRAVINISLPQQMVQIVEENVRAGRYASKSEFFRDLIRSWQEERLLRELRKSEAEIKAGKGIALRSLSDLR